MSEVLGRNSGGHRRSKKRKEGDTYKFETAGSHGRISRALQTCSFFSDQGQNTVAAEPGPYSEQRRDETPERKGPKDGDCQHFYPHLRKRKWGSESCLTRHSTNIGGNWDSNPRIYDLSIPTCFPREGTTSPNHISSLRNAAKPSGDGETLLLALYNLSTLHQDHATGHL